MRSIYLLSGNPMHVSHLHTYKTACEVHGTVFLCFCQSALKDQGLFSLDERREIASKYYGIPDTLIRTFSLREEIVSSIYEAEHIVRGIRDDTDMAEIRKLVSYYGVASDFKKLSPILVPDHLKDISSSKLIERIKNGTYKPSEGWVPEGLYYAMRLKLF